jgi:FkbM family methyltransferase
MNNINVKDIDLAYGSLMELDNRIEFWNIVFDSQEFFSFVKHTKDKNVLLDIGCQYGAFGLPFAKSDANKKAYCFDGSINAWLAVNQTIEFNNLTNVKAHRVLVGDVDGLVGIVYDQHQSLVNTNSNMSDLMLRVDTFCQLFDVAPDCMKIDTEGCDYKVLMGALDTIKTYKPTLFMEIHPNFLKFHDNTIYDVLRVFDEIEYKALDLFGEEITDYKKYLEEETTDSNRTVWIPK